MDDNKQIHYLASELLGTCNGENSGVAFLAMLATLDHLISDDRHDYEMRGLMMQDMQVVLDELKQRMIN